MSKLKVVAPLLVGPIFQGVAMGLLCSFGVEIQKSFIGQVLLPILLNESVKLTAGLLPTLLAPYAFWIMVGIPGLLMAYPFVSMLLNRSFSSSAGEANYTAYALISWALPLGVFAKSMQVGITFATAWYMAAGLAAFTSAYWLTLRPLMSSRRLSPQATTASPSANNGTPAVALGGTAPTLTPAFQNTIQNNTTRSHPPALENRQGSVNIPAFTPRPS